MYRDWLKYKNRKKIRQQEAFPYVWVSSLNNTFVFRLTCSFTSWNLCVSTETSYRRLRPNCVVHSSPVICCEDFLHHLLKHRVQTSNPVPSPVWDADSFYVMILHYLHAINEMKQLYAGTKYPYGIQCHLGLLHKIYFPGPRDKKRIIKQRKALPD